MNYDEAILKIVEHYGISHQAVKAIEERSELTKELCKWLDGRLNREALIDELADDRITGDQIIAFLGAEEDVKKRMAEKVARQIERMRNGE